MPGRDRAIDVVFSDPCRSAMLDKGSDKVSLVAARDAEERKRVAHRRRLRQAGDALDFDFVPFALESSGALGPAASALWKELKAANRKLGQQSRIAQELPHTWSAFTFSQFHMQRLSFTSARATAVAVLQGVKRARTAAGIARPWW